MQTYKRAGKLAAYTLCAAFAAVGGSADAHGEPLSFYNTHTGESVTADPDTREGRRAIRRILRDHRQNETTDIHPRLYDRLENIKKAIEARMPGKRVVFNIISGYRSEKTNEMLRRTRGGQAKTSQHTLGNAIDIRVPGVSTERLRDIAWCEGGGGVGYYPGSKFVHVDVGRKRFWGGNWVPNVKC